MTEETQPTWLAKGKPIDEKYVDEMVMHVRAKAEKGPPQYASHVERELFVDVLKSIAIGVEDPSRLALRALRTLEIPFVR